MTHESKYASDEIVEKIADEVILENKSLLERLAVEEEAEIKKKGLDTAYTSYVEKVQVKFREFENLLQQHSEYKTVADGDYVTVSTKENKVELTTQ